MTREQQIAKIREQIIAETTVNPDSELYKGLADRLYDAVEICREFGWEYWSERTVFGNALKKIVKDNI